MSGSYQLAALLYRHLIIEVSYRCRRKEFKFSPSLVSLNLVTSFREKGIEFINLKNSIDTTTVPGRLTFNIFASFVEFERELIRERTMAGLQAVREGGRIGGRKKGLSPETKKVAYACYQLWLDQSRTK